MGVQLVANRETERQAVQSRGVGGEDAEVAGEHARLARVRAPADLKVPVDEVRVVERARELRAVLVQDTALFSRTCGAVDVAGALGQGPEGIRSEQSGFAVAARE
jgi:hypothetical protein